MQIEAHLLSGELGDVDEPITVPQGAKPRHEQVAAHAVEHKIDPAPAGEPAGRLRNVVAAAIDYRVRAKFPETRPLVWRT